ncbi:RtcB family protein [Myceligenerans indicum]|uniref:3'-phosphate/5'-hydroxy nucleic acid ligase n=1 Tax=Myceligenerans indicum TaxID=2593663 RepID=A0ABS1LIS5_9MICO|nr:RtcB family protein [Myceligenerans indicum]
MSTPFPVALSGARAETLMWAHEHDVDHAALSQLRNISALPWVEGVRVMPDVHLGKGATVGSVIAMRDAVSPNAVGVDIGCGMIGVRTSLTASDLPDDLARLRSRIEAAIPVGFHAHDAPVDLRRLRPVAGSGGRERLRGEQKFWDRFDALHPKVRQLETRARKQLGTLGGGNHFVELCLDQDDRVWLQLHSGSRNIGKSLAEQHVGIAKHLDHNRGLVDRELAVFLAGTPEMDAYLNDLWWAQDYAARSRAVMMALAVQAVREEFSDRDADDVLRFDEGVNVHHNYVARERIDGAELIVTRKGAIRAGRGDLGLIPGSMGTGSFVVRGLGNPRSYWSASHGAGRKMSRSRAKREFTLDDLAAQTAGVECRKDQGVLDEIPGAYKDLDAVIEAQSDLVEVVARLRTVLCVKG